MTPSNIYQSVTGADGDVESQEVSNGLTHVVALSLTKIADGLIDPKLVLSWVLNALGTPAAFIGALVPIREAGALLPQLAIARLVEASGRRKPFWATGSLLQGMAAIGIGVTVLFLEGVAAGWAVLGCLLVLSLARAFCSVTYKDLLADSVAETRRGAVTGAAASAASAVVLGFGSLLAVGIVPLTTFNIAAAILVAGVLWVLGSAIILGVDESRRDSAPNNENTLASHLEPLWRDGQLRRFIATRGLLTATALAPPFIVMLSSRADQTLGTLGPLVLASAAASIFSAYVWGRLSDNSSRRTLAASAALGAIALSSCAASGWGFGGFGGIAGSVAAIFFAQLAYEGVRAGRKIHLTDMASDEHRARYTALSNSVIGVILVLGGGLGVIADIAGPAVVLALLATLCALAVPVALSLGEVQQGD